MKAIVVGAGLAGLSAAYRLQKAGWEVIVLEAADAIGGRTTSFRKGAYLLEKGATQLSTGYARYLELAREVGLGDEIVPCGNTITLMRDGRLYDIDGTRPLTALTTGALSLRSKLLLLRTIRDYRRITPPIDVLNVSASAERVDVESALAYCDRRLNRQIFDVLVDPLIRTYVINRGANVSVLEWFSGLANLAGQKMMALRGGIDRLPAVLAGRLNVRVAAPVATVTHGAQGVEVVLAASAGGETIAADACIVATKLPQARQIVPQLGDAIAPLDDKLAYNRAVVVSLGYARQTASKAMGVLVPTVEHGQIGLVWMEHNKLAESAPSGHSLITCYFEEGGLDTVVPDDDEHFIAIADAFVTKLFPELAGTRDMTAIVRWADAIPNPAPGVYRAIRAFRQRLDPAAPIQLAGDYFTCTGQNSAIHWGQVAADNVLRHIGRSNAPV